MPAVLENQLFQQYATGVEPDRQKFAHASGMTTLLDPAIDPLLLELFFIYFSSRGVPLTEPVEDWLNRSGQRCEAVGFTELGRAIRAHAKAEAGHHHMMIKDTHALVERWNTQSMPPFNAAQLLAQPPTPGGVLYRKLHEETIASDTPFAQIAIEYEIERLPVQYGPQLIRQCKTVLGPDILACLSFIDEHITLDVGHTKFNTQQLEKFLHTHPESVAALTIAGSRVLAAYATFMHDCLDLAQASAEAILC